MKYREITGQEVFLNLSGTSVEFEAPLWTINKRDYYIDHHLFKTGEVSIDITRPIKLVGAKEEEAYIDYVRGQIYFDKPQERKITIKAHYTPLTAVGRAKSVSIQEETEMIDKTVLGDKRKQFMVNYTEITGTIEALYYIDDSYKDYIINNENFLLDISLGDGAFIQSYWIKFIGEETNVEVGELVNRNIDFVGISEGKIRINKDLIIEEDEVTEKPIKPEPDKPVVEYPTVKPEEEEKPNIEYPPIKPEEDEDKDKPEPEPEPEPAEPIEPELKPEEEEEEKDKEDITEEEKEKRFEKAIEKYDIDETNNKITVRGFNPDYTGDKDNIGDITDLELTGDKVVRISSGAFKESNFTGEFPKLDNLQEIGEFAFYWSDFTGEFPKLDNLKEIGRWAFENSFFTGEFPKLDNLKEIGSWAFNDSIFTGEFPKLDNLQEIGKSAFYWSNFTGEFPQLDNLQKIDNFAFKDSKFTDEFPKLDNLQEIGKGAFENSDFTIPEYYGDWDGKSEWIKE